MPEYSATRSFDLTIDVIEILCRTGGPS